MGKRAVLAVTGKDRVAFLQGLVSNDVRRAEGGIVYAALLTAQGKYLADFLVVGQPDRLLIDVDAGQAAMLAQRLALYRLRADVQIAATDLVVSRGIGPAPAGALADPRHPALGWRLYGDRDISEAVDWDALRVAHVVPEAGIELGPETYILEAGFERLSGVDFRKGCYVGQEVTARMKHKTLLRKGLVRVRVQGEALPGTAILTAEGQEAGVLHSRSGERAMAWLRFDRAQGPMRAGAAEVTLDPAD